MIATAGGGFSSQSAAVSKDEVREKFMGIYSGTFSLTRYQIVGGDGGITLPSVNKHLKPYQAKAHIQLGQGVKELVAGWVRPLEGDTDEEGTASHWDMSDAQFDGGFLLRLRIEKRKVPAPLLQLVYRERLQEAREANEGKPLPRTQRKELQDSVKDDLMAQALPQISFLDAVWNDRTGQVLVFTTSRQALNIFEEIFRKTFLDHTSMTLVAITPALMGLTPAEWRGEWEKRGNRMEKMAKALPATFAAQQL